MPYTGFGVGDKVKVHTLTMNGRNRGDYVWTGDIAATDLSAAEAQHLVIPEGVNLASGHKGIWVIELQLIMVRSAWADREQRDKELRNDPSDAWDRAFKGM